MWCDPCGMKRNAGKTKTTIVSWSCTVHCQLTPLTLSGTVLKEYAELVILVVTFDDKMTFEIDAKSFDAKMNLRSVFNAAAQRPGIMRKSLQVFHDRLRFLLSF